VNRLCIVLITLAPAVARANASEDVFGAGARMRAMAGAGTAVDTDWAAVYYNPAALAACRSSAAILVDRIDYNLRLRRDRTDPKKEALEPRDAFTIGICGALPLGLRAGFLFTQGFEQPGLMRQNTTDAVPRFVMYGQRFEAMSIMMALGYELVGGLSLGGGVSLLADTELLVATQLGFAPLDPSETPFSFNYRMRRSTGAHAGLRWEVSDDLALGIAYRSRLAHELDAEVPVTVDSQFLDNPVRTVLHVRSVAWYTPHQAALGGSWRLDPRWLVAADLTWYDWSDYEGPFISAEADIPPEVANTVVIEPPPAEDPRFTDVIWPRLGIEYRAETGWAVRAGYSYRASPAPEPSGRANLLDADTHVLTAGGSYVIEVGDGSIGIDLFVAGGWMPFRDVRKAEAQPVLTSYSFGGTFYSGGLGVSLKM
jgi:long-chain fatty acid transport protein